MIISIFFNSKNFFCAHIIHNTARIVIKNISRTKHIIYAAPALSVISHTFSLYESVPNIAGGFIQKTTHLIRAAAVKTAPIITANILFK